ncbi:hypothetical protein RhiirA4_517753 [Rhizophagus irregularis]|uniref:Uncharacterized protein n=1 Tax=Rhizophagus irregularis TaxID=588596 RepID=A0A2I1GGK4_9GLOM|nr:hypothetical protein RhiirA4_517753 [Rhizophagus irregularis]
MYIRESFKTSYKSFKPKILNKENILSQKIEVQNSGFLTILFYVRYYESTKVHIAPKIGITEHTSVHILVARTFIPNPEKKPHVNHINGIIQFRHDNRAVNLEWVTPKENAERRVFLNPSHGQDYVEQNPDEEWREIEINSQKFRVSSLGRVQLTNVLITKGSLHAGYYRIGRVHRLVALAFSPNEELRQRICEPYCYKQ